MAKVVLFGGSSEIGNAVARELLARQPEKFDHVLRVGRDASSCELEWAWDRDGSPEVRRTIAACQLSRGDACVISLGVLVARSDRQGQPLTLESIQQGINVNLSLPAAVMVESANALADAGGGEIIVMSSAAAFPPLVPNVVYASSKLALDHLALGVRSLYEASGIRVSVVRPGFVPTRLNAGRRPTPLASTAEEVARTVVRSNHRRVIWSPRSIRLVSLALRLAPVLRRVASRRIRDSFV